MACTNPDLKSIYVRGKLHRPQQLEPGLQEKEGQKQRPPIHVVQTGPGPAPPGTLRGLRERLPPARGSSSRDGAGRGVLWGLVASVRVVPFVLKREKTIRISQETQLGVCLAHTACLPLKGVGRRGEGGADGKGTHRSDWVILSFHSPSFSEVFT
ncbi:hypothetical protein MDA_GLEAN10009523 [Myotis davidii]|uniref:Uncharacterized protein n=1 Tax=Myotis davidii TaxID=225400 RepID=L5LIT8_MYODS|nr:hypothetical protein MDA_GLEAN10009523 [Myotis davidii]